MTNHPGAGAEPVIRVEGLEKLEWKRFASGLYEPLSISIVRDTIYVHDRQGIVRLRDINGDGVPDSCEGCYPDCDHSGSLDLFDFLCFQNHYVPKDPYADCDGSGEFDLFDYLCFTNAFIAGC